MFGLLEKRQCFKSFVSRKKDENSTKMFKKKVLLSFKSAFFLMVNYKIVVRWYCIFLVKLNNK